MFREGLGSNRKLSRIVQSSLKYLHSLKPNHLFLMASFKSDRDLGFDLGKYADSRVRVKFQGGREVDGLLKGFDRLDNLVLDDCFESLRGTCVVLVFGFVVYNRIVLRICSEDRLTGCFLLCYLTQL